MKPVSTFELFRLTRFSKPSENRLVYKTIQKNNVRSIVEVGMGDGSRTQTMIRIAQTFSDGNTVRYTGIDLFDSRPDDQPTLLLREAHRRFARIGAKIQLVPGELEAALPRIANSHLRTDLILISAGQDKASLDACWFFMPRMMHAASAVMIQQAAGGPFEVLTRLEIERIADQVKTGRTASRAA